MERMLITCPETAYFEVIEYDRTELGALVLHCSRLDRCRTECTRICAARLDHPHGSDDDRDLDTVALVYPVPYELDHGFEDRP